MDAASRPWTSEANDLWRRISSHSFDDPGVALDFTRRLARMLSWSIETTRAGLEEYRRFCFLVVVNDGAPVTPSEEVDEIWHLHLTYTRDYWGRWCGMALRRDLHHDPTCGGPAERSRYRAQYAETLALYESYFGPPPVAFWPGTTKRFSSSPRYRLVDGDRVLVFPCPKPRFLRLPALVGIFTLPTTPAWAEIWNPMDLTGSEFLELFCFLTAIAALVSWILRALVRKTGRPADLDGLSPVATAYVGGGMSRAADTLFLTLATQGAATHDEQRITILGASLEASRLLEPDLDRLRAVILGAQNRKEMIALFRKSAPARAMQHDLERRNVILMSGRRDWLTLVTALPTAVVVGLGGAKIIVGLSRGRPVEYLVILSIVVGITLLVALVRERYLTTEGSDGWNDLLIRHGRILRAPRTVDLPLAFALGGATVLAGTEHAAYGKSMQSGGDSGCGSSSDSGSGSSDSGCGGCSS